MDVVRQDLKEVSALNIRIKFQKYGVMKFIGHLDIMRYFQKAMRRADIDIAYSEGFSPHQIMSFAAPLGVGITSDGEYLDIEVKSTNSSKASIEALNRVMVEGISVLEYKKLPDMAKTSMALVAAADYIIYIKEGYRNPFNLKELEEKLQQFYQQPEILITKKTKKSETVMDIKPFIYDIKAVSLEDKEALSRLNVKNPDMQELSGAAFFLKVCTGSNTNIKPELVLEAFYRFCDLPYEAQAFQIHRLEVYASSEEIPVKGEKEREEYVKQLELQKMDYQKKGIAFPAFFTLGELGEEIR